METKIQLPKEIPAAIASLPKDKRGYPVPWFVDWIDGEPQFPCMDVKKFSLAITDKLCWVCGKKMGSYKAFVIGPMCGINRNTAEPPSHLECAEFSMKACPFLKNPNMTRIENEVTKQAVSPGGIMIKRNPGVALIWVTKDYKLWKERTGYLITVGELHSIQFWKEGRYATKAEVLDAIEQGCPALKKIAQETRQLRAYEQEKQKFIDIIDREYGGKTKVEKPAALEQPILHRLARWVPKFFPKGRKKGDGYCEGTGPG